MERFFLRTLLAVAEMERNLIVERAQEGKELAKQRADFREGRTKNIQNNKYNMPWHYLRPRHTKKLKQ